MNNHVVCLRFFTHKKQNENDKHWTKTLSKISKKLPISSLKRIMNKKKLRIIFRDIQFLIFYTLNKKHINKRKMNNETIFPLTFFPW